MFNENISKRNNLNNNLPKGKKNYIHYSILALNMIENTAILNLKTVRSAEKEKNQNQNIF